MKVNLLAMLIMVSASPFLFATAGKGQDLEATQVTLELRNEALSKALSQIEAQSNFRFTYKVDEVSRYKGIKLKRETRSVKETLELILDNTKLEYQQIDNYIILAARPTTVEDLELQVTGKVTDDAGEPLPGVNVLVKGTTNGTSTDVNGEFVLMVEDGSSTLVFSFIGYLNQEIPVGQRAVIDVIMKPDVTTLSEVVVIGYGTQERKDLTGSIGSVKASEVKDLGVTRIEQALAGRVGGVQVKMVTGEPGASPQVMIRGIGSISAGGSPLYVVDGFPTDNIQTLNPSDIETLDVLKDASATAIYGSRGSNGVVIINTKRGKSGKTIINFDSYFGWQKVSKIPKMKNSIEQANYFLDGMRNKNIDAGNNVSGYPTTWAQPVPPIIMDIVEGRNTVDEEPLDAILVDGAPQQQYQLSAQGGSDKVKFAISGEYFDQDGIVVNSEFQRYSVRTNLDAQLTERFSIKMNLNPSVTRQAALPSTGVCCLTQGVVGGALNMHNWRPMIDENGNFFNYDGLSDLSAVYNPLAVAKETIVSNRGMRVLGNLNAEYKFTDALRLNIMLGGNAMTTKGMMFKPQRPYFFNDLPVGSDNASLITNWINEYTLNYNKNFGDHNIQGLLGYTMQKERGEMNSMTSNRYPNNLVPTLSAVGGLITGGTSDIYEWSLLSYLARASYNYKGKYYLTASIRTDGSSRFGSQNKYGIFPSVAAAYRLSDETFMKGVSFISNLKFRVSYGETGNNNIGNYDQYATIRYANYPFGGAANAGTSPGRLPNPNLTWEKQRSFNQGIDIAVFNGRISLTVDHFTSRNTDLLLNVNIPNVTGFSTALQNIGEVKNTGWEFVLSTVNIPGQFKWTTDFNLSSYRNEVVRLGPEGDPIYVGNNVTMIGQPIGMFFGFLTDGIFKTQAELNAGPIYNPGAADRSRVGDIRFKDLNGDGVINNSDRAIMGSPYPDFYYGMTNRFEYKSFSLNVTLQGSKGSMIYNLSRGGGNSTRARVRGYAFSNDYWKSESDPGDGFTPRPNDTPTGGVRLPSELFLDTGTYLRINNITLGYLVPTAIVERMRLSSLRVYVSMNNPFVFTKNTAFNPDVNMNASNPLSPGNESSDYPLPKSFLMGLNLSF